MAATVLVIDDDPSVRDSLAAFLVDYDYRVLTAPSADAAWPELENNHVDAVICDLRMPGTNGIEWLEQVKEREPRLPVIVASGAGVMDDVVRALRLGADDFLVKPILDLEVLHHALRRALERARLEAENNSYREYLEKTNLELKRGLDELRSDQLAGRQVQIRMLPEPLNFRDIECQHLIIPSLLLSGDFLDYFELGEHKLVFYIADVSGHGASSAFVTVLLKNLTYRLRRNFRRGSSDDLLHPAQVLQRVNAEVLATGLDKFLTMIYCILDTRTGQMEYSVGGHLPMPVLLTREGVRFLEGRGRPVGLFPEAEYPTYTVQLPEDYRLMMFSDGVLEILDADSLPDREQKLLEQVSAASASLNRFCQGLGLDLEERPELPDDIAMMVIGRGKL